MFAAARRHVDRGEAYGFLRGAINDFLFEIADDNIQGTPREQVRIGVMETGVGQLSIRGGAREVSHSQAGKKDHKGKHNNKRRGLVRRSPGQRRSGPHYLALLVKIKITFVQPNTGNRPGVA